MSQVRRRRRSFSPDEKAVILRRHLAEKVPISALAEEYGIQPSVLYQWQRQLLDHAATVLGPQAGKPDHNERKLTQRIEALEARLQKKDSVIAEISAEYVSLKKELGEL
jgi:transposase-like protein